MKSINFLQVVLAIAAAGILCLYNRPAHGDSGFQCIAGQENAVKGCNGGCCTRFHDAEKCGGKDANEEEGCTTPADKEKPAGETGERVKDFCRLKDLY